MSSLMQFNGDIGSKGVGLMFYKERPFPYTSALGLYGAECYVCSQCAGSHEQLYRAYRKPAGMFGPWVVFRYNGRKHVPDLRVPISIDQLPRDAKPLSIEECTEYWHN